MSGSVSIDDAGVATGSGTAFDLYTQIALVEEGANPLTDPETPDADWDGTAAEWRETFVALHVRVRRAWAREATAHATFLGAATEIADGANVATDQSTASTSYTDLTTPGPAVSIETGTSAIVYISSSFYNSLTPGWTCSVAVEVSGATTIAAADANAVISEGAFETGGSLAGSRAFLLTGLTPGINTFTLKYKVNGQTFHFYNRSIAVMNLAAVGAAAEGNGSVGVFADRPAAGEGGRTWYSTDGGFAFLDDGAAWRPLLPGGIVGTQPPAAASFAAVNSTGTLAIADDAKGGLIVNGNNEGPAIVLRGFTVANAVGVEALIGHLPLFGTTGEDTIGVMARESGTGKAYVLGITLDHNLLLYAFQFSVWTNNTTRASVAGTVAPLDPNAPIMVRVRKVGANMIADYCRNGDWANAVVINTQAASGVFTTAFDTVGIMTHGYSAQPRGLIPHFKAL